MELSINRIHSSIPKFHSRKSPKVKIFRNSAKRRNLENLSICKSLNLGNKMTSSRSKIRKIKATIKNRIEKGSRPSPRVENPHSKGERKSRLLNHFLEAKAPTLSKTRANATPNKSTKSHIKIKEKINWGLVGSQLVNSYEKAWS